MSRSFLDNETKKNYATFALDWCRENIGINERKRTELRLEFSEVKRKKNGFIFYGTYCFYKNRILIYIENCNTIFDIVSTIIHEYTHYLQSRTKYKTYVKTYNYSRNPYERQAKRFEQKHTKECTKYVRSYSTSTASSISVKKKR